MNFQTFTIILEKDEPSSWHASVKELPGCHSCGKSPEEARHNILEALELYRQEKKAQNKTVNSPIKFIEHVTIPIAA